MNQETVRIIDDAKKDCLSGKGLSREVILKLLAIDPDSPECDYLGKSAREAAAVICENKGIIGSAIGVDLAPCSMSCDFCSLGEKWGIVKETFVFPTEEIVEVARYVIGKGFGRFTLRTTDNFEVDRLCELVSEIRKHIPGKYAIVINTGDLTLDEAKRLKECGVTAAYHSIRLGEGKDTDFTVEERIATAKNLVAAGIKLNTGLDPVGPEHTDEEIADRILLFRELNPITVCVMKRIPVPGTPMGNLPALSERRHAQLAAVVRLSGGGVWRNVSSSPPNRLAASWGANNITITTGASPRHNVQNLKEWTVFDHDGAKKYMTDSGYIV